MTEENFSEYFRLYNARLTTFILGRLSQRERQSAEDIVAEAWLRAWRFRSQFEGRNGCSFLTWLTRIALNTMAVRRRDSTLGKNSAVMVSVEVIEGTDYDPRIAPGTDEDSLHARNVATDIMNSLRPVDQQWFRLIFHEDRSLSEAAAITGLSVPAIKKRTYTMRTQLAGRER